jgi:predicted PurR-regulated permease PerM
MLNAFSEKYLTPKNIVFFVCLLLFLIFLAKIKDIAILFFAAFVFACSLNPIVDRLSQKLNRSLASAIVLTATVLIIGAFFIPVIWLAGEQIKSFIDHVPQYIDTVRGFILATPILGKSALAQLDIGGLISSTSGITSKFVNESINISLNFASAIIYIFAMLIITFYFMSDKVAVSETMMSLFPHQMKERAREIIGTISEKIGGYVIAQIATMSSVGIIMTLGLLILGVDYAVLLGLMTAVLDIIPVVGPAIALAITLVTVYKLGWVTILLVVLVFAIAQGVENNLVRPYVFGKFLDLHPLVIYFFIFVTAQFLGVVGVIFAPAIAATVCVLIEELYVKNIN